MSYKLNNSYFLYMVPLQLNSKPNIQYKKVDLYCPPSIGSANLSHIQTHITHSINGLRLLLEFD